MPAEAPIRSAPASIIAKKALVSLIPPDALTKQFEPTVSRINLTSSIVAPPVEKPVDVLTKSAPASTDNLQALTFSSSVNKQVSIITFKINSPHAFLIAAN